MVDKKDALLESLSGDFLRCLHDSNGFNLYAEFLESEFSVENLYFWKDCQTMFAKQSPGKHEFCTISALNIYDIYIRADAPLCINISGPLRKKLLKLFSEISQSREFPGLLTAAVDFSKSNSSLLLDAQIVAEVPKNVFEEAIAEVVSLMLRDSFYRFRRTEKYYQWNTKHAAASSFSSLTSSLKRSTLSLSPKGSKKSNS